MNIHELKWKRFVAVDIATGQLVYVQRLIFTAILDGNWFSIDRPRHQPAILTFLDGGLAILNNPVGKEESRSMLYEEGIHMWKRGAIIFSRNL